MQPITIQLLDKEYKVACPEEEQESLHEAARYLNGRMREIRDSGKAFGMDRIAVMAALNIVHELLQIKQTGQQYDDSVSTRLRSLQDHIDAALAEHGSAEA